MPAEKDGHAQGSRGLGRVYLVGAGPGDPGLLTVRARELIAAAETVLYDRLVGPGILDAAGPEAELVFVGKQGGGEAVPQERIVQLLLEHARRGRAVVRLKGGDPFVFGRGGEEALALRAAGIPYEVVPGVTAGIAAPAYAGIPVTHRGRAGAVAFVTGRSQDGPADERTLDWPALASFPGTLVFYMGVRALPQIVEGLLGGGRPAGEPVAIVEAGTLPRQRTVRATLATAVEAAARDQVRAPSVTVVGAVAELADELAWLGPRPLAGRTVAVTRARAQASGLAERLAALGAETVQAPTIRIVPLDGPAPELGRYDLVCLTSANGVELLFERLSAAGLDARALAGARIAAIGPGTERALAAHGLRADVVPARSVAESLVQALEGVEVARALVATAAQARDVLPRALRERGVEVDVLALYETVAEQPAADVLDAALRADYLLFTSSSTVTNFLAASDGRAIDPAARIVSIGPVTSQTLREHGIEPHLEADQHDVDGLIATVLAAATGG